ncbi:hypothetical protein, partial [Furfurilactobacillus siliginis]|uniref:Uncharacterized protein n=1 Tax=Furfurilactobacillus siliginis TaxID=348151 RepID=A0A510VQW8_9LACO
MLLTVITIVIGIALALIIYRVVQRMIVRHASTIVTSDAQSTTAEAMTAALEQMVTEHTLVDAQRHYSDVQTVADVWGRGVMAFEFTIASGMLAADELPTLRRPLNNALGEYAGAHHVKRISTAHPTFIVTDLWLFEGNIHIDVAYLMNESTVEYIQDLKKLSASEKEESEK